MKKVIVTTRQNTLYIYLKNEAPPEISLEPIVSQYQTRATNLPPPPFKSVQIYVM
jgi:hypothetical protein